MPVKAEPERKRREKMEKEYTYNAFISYRHLPLDEAVAERTQKLLEQYKPPKGITPKNGKKRLRIFRDTTELPTSGSLDDALRRALLSSEYLIVILSEETIHSAWCMAEIREFKEAHNGSIANILPILVSGKPADIIPQELRCTNVEVTQPDGRVVEEDREVEPLCANIQADSRSGVLKRLKTEFLRIAAPLLGCGFDDLFRRHARRQKKILITGFLVTTAIFAVLATVFGRMIYAINWRDQLYKQKQEEISKTYIQQAMEEVEAGDNQKAMTYVGGVLANNNNIAAARSSAFLMLQKSRWPYLTNARQGEIEDFQKSDNYNVKILEDVVLVSGGETNLNAKIPRPTDVNPAVKPEFVESAAESTPVIKCAAGRVIIRHGEYVYEYDVTQDLPILKSRIDLAEIFTEEAESGSLFGWGQLWVSDDASLIAVDCMPHVAIINMEEQIIEAMVTYYFYSLNEVVFSHTGDCYALIYGNYTDVDIGKPGGFIQIYDLNNEVVFETEVNEDIAFQGAAFSPEDSLLIAWGSGAMQFFNVRTGEPYAETLRCRSLKSACFHQGKIVLDNGNGKLYDCAFSSVSLKPVEKTDSEDRIETQNSWDKYETRGSTVEITDGMQAVLGLNRLRLTDKDGNVLSEVSFEEKDVNRMLIDREQQYLYIWFRNESGMLRIPYNTERAALGTAQALDTRGFEVADTCLAGNGILVITGNGYLLYYADPQTDIPKSMKVGMQGRPREVVVNEDGLAGVIVVRVEAADGFDNYHFDEYFGVELWDLDMEVRIAEFEKNNQYKLSDIAFDKNGFLSYQKLGERIFWRVDAPVPDEQTIGAIQQITCLTLDKNQVMAIRSTYDDHLILGNWSDLLEVEQFTVIKETIIEQADENKIITEAHIIFKSQGAEAWQDFYDKIWDQIEQKEMLLNFEQESALFRDYSEYARSYKELTNRIGRGIRVYMEIAVEQSMTEAYATATFDIQMGQTLVLTDAYDSLMKEYWNHGADYALDVMKETGKPDLLNYATVYENRMLVKMLEKRGIKAFTEACDEIGTEYLGTLYEYLPFDVFKYLVKDEPEEAAAAFDNYVKANQELNPQSSLEDLYSDIMMPMFEMNFIERVNNISIETINRFISSTDYVFGLELNKQSCHTRESGLRVGDVVIAVNGHYFCNMQHLRRLTWTYPEAELTYLRDGEIHQTGKLVAWEVYGDFVVREVQMKYFGYQNPIEDFQQTEERFHNLQRKSYFLWTFIDSKGLCEEAYEFLENKKS